MNIKLFGLTEKELKEKTFNIFVGISLGNKHISVSVAREYLKFAIKHSKREVLVLIADKIDSVNWEVFRGFSAEDADKKVINKGNGLAEMFKNVLNKEAVKSGEDILNRVRIVKWEDIKDDVFINNREAVSEEYKNNENFRRRILYFVEEYAKIRNRTLNSREKDKLAGYIISELPTLINGVKYGGISYELIFYPSYVSSGMSEFVLDIQRGEYPELSEKMIMNGMGKMVECYIR